jgi:hypothetical protein
MSRLPADLPQRLRAHGLKVVEHDGWLTRGRPASTGGFDPVGVLCHHTATGKATSDANVVRLLIGGRSDLPGPLCHMGLARDGTVHMIAAGRANHAGKAKASGTVGAGDGNVLYIGIEAFNDGVGEKWPTVQYDAYALLAAVLSDEITNNSAQTVRGHKETSVTGKIDPTFDMNAFRSHVAADLAKLTAPPTAEKPETTVTALPLAFKTPMPANTQRAHFDPAVGDARWAIDHVSEMAIGPDLVRALDFNIQTVILLVDGKRVHVAIGAHWKDCWRNGWRAWEDEHGQLHHITDHKLSMQDFIDAHGGDKAALHMLRRLDKHGKPTNERPLTLYDAMKYAKAKHVALCPEAKDDRLEVESVAKRVVDHARKLDYPCWPMALEEMHAAEKCAAFHAAGSPFALILGEHQSKAHNPHLLDHWKVAPTHVWASTPAGRAAGAARIKAWHKAHA